MRLQMTRLVSMIFLLSFLSSAGFAQRNAIWHAASEEELHTVIPARAPAISERIETEFRTASGITDGHGHFVAGVVMITAGYSAEGKYSHFFLTQVPLKIGGIALSPGNYLFGWSRAQGTDVLKVNFYRAANGSPAGQVEAHRDISAARVESFRIWPPSEKSVIQIGRFAFAYSVSAP